MRSDASRSASTQIPHVDPLWRAVAAKITFPSSVSMPGDAIITYKGPLNRGLLPWRYRRPRDTVHLPLLISGRARFALLPP